MHYLIDGYNLLHALEAPRAGAGPKGMDSARRRLLDLIHLAHGAKAQTVTVVFDARRLPPGVAAEQHYRGVRVRFAVGYPEADDLLEHLIDEAASPNRLAIVSDDHRIQRAARRRGCVVTPCDEYMDRLGRLCKERLRKRPAPEKPDSSTDEETALWRQAFADLEGSAAMRELFDLPWSDEPEWPPRMR